MAVKLTLDQATAALGVLQRLMPALMPAKYSYAVARCFAALSGNADVAAAESTRQQLVHRYGSDDGNGNVLVKPADLGTFIREFGEIAQQTVELELPLLPAEILDVLPELAAIDMARLIVVMGPGAAAV